MNVKTWLFALAFAFSSLFICSLVQAQDWQPAAFAVSTPQSLDQSAAATSYQAMSPDSWGQPLRRSASSNQTKALTVASYQSYGNPGASQFGAGEFRPAIPQNVQAFVAAQQQRIDMLNDRSPVNSDYPAASEPYFGPMNQIVSQQPLPQQYRGEAVSTRTTAKRSSIMNSQTYYVRKAGK